MVTLAEPRWVLEHASGILIEEGGANRIDRAARVIRGVKILGLESRNPARVLGLTEEEFGDAVDQTYCYTMEALHRAKALYENAKVFLDHTAHEFDQETGRRIVHASDTQRSGELLGWLSNITVVEGQGLYGDLNYLAEHPFTPRLLEIAERNPAVIGLSHEAMFGEPRLVNGRIALTSISHVERVALITERPGTVYSLFESSAPRKVEKMQITLRKLFEGSPVNTKHRDILGKVIEQMDGDDFGGDMTPDMPVDMPVEASTPEQQILNGLLAALSKAASDAVANGDTDTLKRALKAFGLSDSVTEMAAGLAAGGEGGEGGSKDETPIEPGPNTESPTDGAPADDAPPDAEADTEAADDDDDSPVEDDEVKFTSESVMQCMDLLLESGAHAHATDRVMLETMLPMDEANRKRFATSLGQAQAPVARSTAPVNPAAAKKDKGVVQESAVAEKYKDKGSLARSLRATASSL